MLCNVVGAIIISWRYLYYYVLCSLAVANDINQIEAKVIV